MIKTCKLLWGVRVYKTTSYRDGVSDMRKIIALLISVVPLNIGRIFLYNTILGYQISYSAKIGFGTILNLGKVKIGKARIGFFNRFGGGFALNIGDGTDVGSFNEFNSIPGSSKTAYCEIGKKAHITKGHFFDTTGGISIGDYTRVAGRASQFWTHGGQREGQAIQIKDKCYIGSAVRFAQGVIIPDNTFVGLGSVVVDSFAQPGTLVFGFPAKSVKDGIVARKSLSDSNND